MSASPYLSKRVMAMLPPKRNMRDQMRQHAWDKSGGKCTYCGCDLGDDQRLVYPADLPFMTIDHVIPRSAGGKHVPENCVSSCQSCNSRKGARAS